MSLAIRIIMHYNFLSQTKRILLSRYLLLTVPCVITVISLTITVIYVIKLPARRLLPGRHGAGITKSPERRCPPLPAVPRPPSRLPKRFPGLSCAPHYHLGFLKTHRSGSSAVQSLLFRLAARHQLVPLLPPPGARTIGSGPFQASDTCHMPGRRMGFHLINVATRWNHSQIQRVLPNDTVFFTIVREPVSQFLSLFHHLELEQFVSLQEFVAQEPIPVTRLGGVFGRNQQLWDFGLPQEQLTNHTSIKEKISEIERQFELVMIAERMDESLVLLRHLLCWPTGYVVTMKLNTLISPPRLSDTSPARARLAEWLSGDRLLYRHFYDRFEQSRRRFGDERMRREVRALREETLRVVNECKIARSPSALLPELNQWRGDRVYGLSARNNSQDCQMYVVGEGAWLQLMRGMVEELTFLM